METTVLELNVKQLNNALMIGKLARKEYAKTHAFIWSAQIANMDNVYSRKQMENALSTKIMNAKDLIGNV